MDSMAFIYGLRHGRKYMLFAVRACHVGIIREGILCFDIYVNRVHVCPVSDDNKYTIEGDGQHDVYVSSDGVITDAGKAAGIKYTSYGEVL